MDQALGSAGDDGLQRAAAGLFEGLLKRSHLSRTSDAATVVVEEVQRALGASEALVYLINHEYTALVPLPSSASPPREAQDIDSTPAGKAFSLTRVVDEA